MVGIFQAPSDCVKTVLRYDLIWVFSWVPGHAVILVTQDIALAE